MSHRYDDFVAQLARGPITISEPPWDSYFEVHCTGRYFEVTRSVVRLEFAGYRQCGNNHARLVPCVREVFACGHSEENTAGQFSWQRPRRTAMCCKCSDAIPPIDDEEEL